MSVLGPYPPRHPSPLRRPAKVPRSSTNYQPTVVPPPPADPFYGHRDSAELCQRFIRALFACPDRPPPSTSSPQSPTPPLALFVAYALHRTRLHPSVTFTALFLLSRLKARFPAARGSSGHRLFISAFMIASKVVCDDTYSNKSWTVVGQGMFSLREINQMEREMCGYLEWILNVDPKDLREFEGRVRKDYALGAPCPAFVHPPQLAPAAATAAAPPSSASTAAAAAAAATTSHNQLENSAAPDQPSLTVLEPHLPSPPDSPHRRTSLPRALAPQVLGPTPVPVLVGPATPQLGPREDDSPSPASSTTCLTPQSDDDDADDATIVSTGMQSELGSESGPTRTSSALSFISAASLPKSKVGRDPSFAFPSRTVW